MAAKKKRKKPRGKKKGSAYERKIASLIAENFADFGIVRNDCYRTVLSGGLAGQKGDLQFSPQLEKLIPFTVECKHYKKLNLEHLLYSYEDMMGSWKWRLWWKQLRAEMKITKKPGLLVFRGNNTLDLCSFYAADYSAITDVDGTMPYFVPMYITYRKQKAIWTIPFLTFLSILKKEAKRVKDKEGTVSRKRNSR